MADSEVFQPVRPRQGAPEEGEARAVFKMRGFYSGLVCAGLPGVTLTGLTDCSAFLELQARDPPCWQRAPGSPQEASPTSLG